jgi:hypothetical protein
MVDPRRVTGNIVIAKACHVTNLAECARRYGAKKSRKMVEGIVVDVIMNRRDPAKKAEAEVVADYDLGGRAIKRAIIKI